MIINFTVDNVFSFKEETTFSLQASSVREFRDTHTTQVDTDYYALNGAAIYGANASGKSNLLKSLLFMKQIIQKSAESIDGIKDMPDNRFKLNTSNLKRPSLFRIEFSYGENIYKYEFEFTHKNISRETLFIRKKVTEMKIFSRVGLKVELHPKYSDAEKVVPFLKPESLFLSSAALLAVGWARNLVKSFDKIRHLHIRYLHPVAVAEVAGNYFDGHKYKTQIEKLLIAGNLGFDRIGTKTYQMKPSAADSNIPSHQKFFFSDSKFKIIYTVHNQLDDKGNIKASIPFDLEEESDGTRKYFSLLGPIVEALAEGMTLIVDEFTSHLHPLLAEQLVKLFHNKNMNKGNGQLIIATHNTYLLNKDLYRKDQIFFTEKDKNNSTQLINLTQFKEIRQNTSFEKRYIHDQELCRVPELKINESNFWN